MVTNKTLATLKTLPLANLDLNGASKITDYGLEELRDLQLTEFRLFLCQKITDRGLAALSGMLDMFIPSCWTNPLPPLQAPPNTLH